MLSYSSTFWRSGFEVICRRLWYHFFYILQFHCCVLGIKVITIIHIHSSSHIDCWQQHHQHSLYNFKILRFVSHRRIDMWINKAKLHSCDDLEDWQVQQAWPLGVGGWIERWDWARRDAKFSNSFHDEQPAMKMKTLSSSYISFHSFFTCAYNWQPLSKLFNYFCFALCFIDQTRVWF